jgi:threonine-phosphate decarboxylase
MPEGLLERIRDCAGEIRVYPDPDNTKARTLLSEKLSVPKECILFGNGSCELIHTIAQLRPKRAWIPYPTFTEYERAFSVRGIPIEFIGLEEDFSLDFSKVRAEEGDVVVLCNPNNPTGNFLFPPEDVLDRWDAITVVDEAYIQFTKEESLVKYAAEKENLIVLSSFTKSFSVPGLRIGYAVSNYNIIYELSQLLPFWNLNRLAEIAVWYLVEERVDIEGVEREREWLSEKLECLGLRVYPSVANFLLIELESPSKELFEQLLERGILIRECSDFRGLSDRFIRVSVRDRKENEKLVREIEEVLIVRSKKE